MPLITRTKKMGLDVLGLYFGASPGTRTWGIPGALRVLFAVRRQSIWTFQSVIASIISERTQV